MGPRLYQYSLKENTMSDSTQLQMNQAIVECSLASHVLSGQYAELDKLNAQVVALEYYQDVLTRGIENGGLSVDTMMALTTGLEAMPGTPLFTVEELTLALEDASTARSAASKKTSEALGRRLAQIRDKIIELLKVLMQQLKDTWTKINFAAIKVREKAQQLHQKVTKLPAGNPRKDTIELVAAGRLFTNGTYQGDKSSALSMYGALVTKELPDAILSVINNYVYLLREIDPKKPNGFEASFTKSFKELPLGIKDFTKGPDADAGNGHYREQSPLLPGNMRVYTVRPTEVSDMRKFLTYMTSDMNTYIAHDDNTKKPPEKYNLRVARPGDLKRQLDTIIAVADKVINTGNGVSAIQRELNTVSTTAKTLATRANSMDKPQAINTILNAAQGLQRLPNGVTGSTTHLVKTLNMCCAVIEKQMSLYTPKQDAN